MIYFLEVQPGGVQLAVSVQFTRYVGRGGCNCTNYIQGNGKRGLGGKYNVRKETGGN
jgi:hypothetical protein